MREQTAVAKRYEPVLLGLLVAIALYLTRLHSYLLFHSLAELFSIVIAGSIFAIFWNSRRVLENSYFLFIAITFLFVGGLDLLHMLAYKGMGVFPGYDANLPTQLWIAARYTQSLSFLVAPLFIGRKLRVNWVLWVYAMVTVLLLASIFGGLFPVCYVEGVGLTPFKRISEYIISAQFLAAMLLLLHKRQHFDTDVVQLLGAAFAATISAELASTFYVGVYDLSNLIGHLFRITAFYLTSVALVRVGLQRPYDLLFRELKQNEAALRESEATAKALLNTPTDAAVLIDTQGTILGANETMARRVGRQVEDLVGASIWDLAPADVNARRGAVIDRVIQSATPVRHEESRPGFWYDTIVYPIFDAEGQVSKVAILAHDITEHKQLEEELRRERDLLDRVVTTSPVGIMVLDRQGQVTFANAYAEQIMAAMRLDLSERDAWHFTDLAGNPIPREQLPPYQVFHTASPVYDMRCAIAGPAGQQRFLAINAAPLLGGSGEVSSVVVVGQDVTQVTRAEEAHRRSERQLRGLVEQSQDGISLVDEQGRVVEWNPAMERITGLPASEVLGQTIWDVQFRLASEEDQTPEAYERHKTLTSTALESGRVPWAGRLMQREYQRPDGTRRAIEGVVFPIETAQGIILANIVRDVTARLQVEETLRIKDNALASSLNAIVMADLEGRITYANASFLKLWGYTAEEEVLGKQAVQFWQKRERATEVVVALRAGESWRGEEVAQRQDGTLFHVEVAANLVVSATGHPLCLLASLVDITERKQIQERLEREEMCLKSLLELSQQASQLSEQEIVQRVIEEAARLTGSPFGFLHFVSPDGKTIQLVSWTEKTKEYCTTFCDSHYPLDQAGVWADCVRLGKPVLHNDYQNLPDRKGYPEGHAHLIRHASVPILDEGKPVLILGVGNKDTDYDASDVQQMIVIGDRVLRILRRKRAEEQLQASLREKTVLLQEVHHRVKNNLQVISSLLDMQAMNAHDPPTLQALQDSRNRIRAMAFVHDHVYQSRDLARIDMADYIRSVVSYLHGVYGNLVGDVHLDLQVEGVLLDLGMAIPCALIINELVSNALKYAFPSANGSGQIRVEFRAQADNRLVLTISDNGRGLSPDLDVENTPSLGLRLVHMLSQQLQGTIAVDGKQGTTFQIVFPQPGARQEAGS